MSPLSRTISIGDNFTLLSLSQRKWNLPCLIFNSKPYEARMYDTYPSHFSFHIALTMRVNLPTGLPEKKKRSLDRCFV